MNEILIFLFFIWNFFFSFELHNIILRLVWFGFMVFNATFNNISVVSWWSDLLVEETGGSGENH
jgi:hypothetical protein